MKISESVGRRIRIYREGRKISREDLAELTGLHPTYIGQLERGEKNPTIETLYKISSGLEIPLDYLVNLPASVRDGTPFSRCVNLLENQTQKEQKYLYELLNAFLESEKH